MTGKHVGENAREPPQRVCAPPPCRSAHIIDMPDQRGTIAAQIARFRSQPPLPRDSRWVADACKNLLELCPAGESESSQALIYYSIVVYLTVLVVK